MSRMKDIKNAVRDVNDANRQSSHNRNAPTRAQKDAVKKLNNLLDDATPEERARVKVKPGRLISVKWR